jgi:hypothetical protein
MIKEHAYLEFDQEAQTRPAQLPTRDAIPPRRVSGMRENLAETWSITKDTERTAVARGLFFDVVIGDRRVVAVETKPGYFGFIEIIAGEMEEVRTDSSPQKRKRRDSNPRSQP